MVEELRYQLARQLADALNAIDENYELTFRPGPLGGNPELVLCERGDSRGWVPVAAVIDVHGEEGPTRWAVMMYT